MTIFKGAFLSSMRVRVELKNFTRESRSKFSTLEKAAAISICEVSFSISILKLLKLSADVIILGKWLIS